MKRLLLIAAALAVLPALAPAAAPAPDAAAPKTEADLAYEAMMAGWRTPTPAGLQRQDHGLWEHQDRTFRKFSADARAFAAKYPTDPRRREAIIQSSFTRPWFLTGFKPEFEQQPTETNLLVDQPALNAWRATQLKLLAEIIEAPDTTARQRGAATQCYFIDSRADARDRGVPFDLAAATALVERVIARMPDERAVPVVGQYLALVKDRAPERAKALEAKLQSIPSLATALAPADAKRQQAAAEKLKKLADLTSVKFTAADGREVDLTKLRGKVVLIDFWATWCGPCVKEIPTVVAAYEKYHAKGFEVIGVTLENASLKPDDTPEQTAAKLAVAKKKMQDFAAAKNMPWPQHYDGQFWKNELAVKFGIQSIPAMFLLDQEGRIASTEARGEALDREVRRLLKL